MTTDAGQPEVEAKFYSVTLNDTHQPYLTFLSMNKLKIQRQLCDIELRIGEAKFNAHQIVLAASSPYLLQLISTKPSVVSHITLSDANLQIFAVDLLVEFIYTSILKITQTTVKAICYAAKTLKLVRAEGACCKFIHNYIQSASITDTQLMEYLFFAKAQGYKSLQVKCIRQLTKKIDSLITNDLFLTLPPDKIYQFVELFDSASTIELLSKWVDRDHNVRQEYLKLLINSLKVTVPSNYNTSSHHIEAMMQQEMTACSAAPIITPPTPLKNIYIAGGNTNISITADVEMYDPKENTWKSVPGLLKKKSHSSLVAGGGQLYLIGGFDGSKRVSSVDIYNQSFRQWVPGPSLKYPRSGCGATIFKEEIYVVGGYSGSDHMTSVEIYNPKTKVWRDGPSLIQPRSYVQVAAMNGILYAVGGADNNGRLSSVEKLTDCNSQWSKGPSMIVCRSRPGVAVINSKALYACGGYNGHDHLNSIECLEVDDNKWKKFATMSTARNSPGVCAIGQDIHIFGGYNGRCILDSMEIFHTRTNTWSQGPPLLNPCCDFGYTTCSVPIASTNV